MRRQSGVGHAVKGEPEALKKGEVQRSQIMRAEPAKLVNEEGRTFSGGFKAP